MREEEGEEEEEQDVEEGLFRRNKRSFTLIPQSAALTWGVDRTAGKIRAMFFWRAGIGQGENV